MPQTVNGGKIQFGVGFNVDQSGLKQLEKSLSKLQNVKMGDLKNGGTFKDLKEIQETAQKVQEALKNAFNVKLGSLNIDKFNQELKKSDLNIDKIYTDFSKVGAQGQKAFSQMASQVLNTNLKLKQTKSIVDSLGQTFINSIKWNVASSAINAITGSISQAFGYVKNLDSSLTNIRIVTGDSKEQMAQFAVEANNAAAALGKTTRDYTDAALSFYQQGLNDEEVRVRTEASLKAQNITQGQASVDELTAVWNGYQVSVADTQKYVDKLAAVADSSASDMSQLATAMSKVAATANVMGVDIDQLTAQIATIVATTRQAPQTVGNALKTIYARINDIKAGTDDAETSLGNYSSKMAALGFSVLDSNGNLRQTGQVMEEIGERWTTLTKEQQVYLAQTMAGQRQYNQLISLFDNWTQYSEMLNVSLESEGTLNEKNARYMESLAAHMEQFTAARQNLMDSMLNADSMKSFVDVGTTVVNLLAKFVDSIGGGGNALLALGSIATTVFSKQIGNQINNLVTNFQNLKYNTEAVQKQMQMTQLFGQSEGYKKGAITEMVDAQEKISKYNNIITNQQRTQYNEMVKKIGLAKQNVINLKEEKQQVGRIVKSWTHLSKDVRAFNDILEVSPNSMRKINDEFENVQAKFNAIVEGIKKVKVGKSISTQTSSQINQLLIDFEKLNIVPKTTIKNLKDQFAHLSQQGVQPTQEQIQHLLITLDQFQQTGNTKINLIGKIFDTGPELVQKYEAQLNLAKQATKSFQDQLGQLAQSVNVTKIVGGIGQISSSLLQLKSIGNIWTDENLSGGEKFLRTVSNLAFSLPMLATGLTSVSTALGFESSLLDVIKTKMAARQALQTQQVATLVFRNTVQEAYNKLQAGQIAVEEYNNSIKSAGILLTNTQTAATLKQKAAQDALNTSMLANPIFLGVAAAVGAVYGLIKVIDHFTVSTKEAEENLEKFKETQQSFIEKNKKMTQDIGSLDAAAKEYQYLSEKAGLYDSNINSLTQSQKQRYNQIRNLIAEYLPQQVAYWDAQGNAILNDIGNLQTYITELKKAQALQLQKTYGKDSQDRKTHTQSVQTQFKNSYVASSQANEIEGFNSSSSQTVDETLQTLDNILSIAEQTSQAAKEGREKLVQFQNEAIKTGNIDVQSFDAVIETITSDEKLDDLTKTAINNAKNTIDTYYQSFSEVIQDRNNKIKEDLSSDKFKFDNTFILNSFKADNTDLVDQLFDLGGATADAYISSYISGLRQYDFTDYEQGVEEGAIQAATEFATKLRDVLKEQPSLQEEISKFWFDDQGKQIDFSSLNVDEYNQQLTKFINNLFKNNQTIKNLSKENPELAQSLIESLFGLKGVKIDSSGIVSQIENQYTTLREDIVTKLLAKGYDKQEIELFKPSIGDLKNQDAILDRIGQKVGSLEEDWEKATRAQKNYTALSEGASALSLLEKRGKGQSLSKEEKETLQMGLNSLGSAYTDLADKVAILNNEQLQGTREYQRALEDTKAILIENLAIARQNGEMSKSESIQYTKQLVTSMENLQQAYTNGSLFGNDYSQTLLKLASNYESCTNEINNFKSALDNKDQALYRSSGLELQVAVRSAEISEKTGIEAERVSSLANKYLELAQSGNEEYAALAGSAEAATDAAERYIKLNDAIESLYEHLDDYKNLLIEATNNGLDDIYANKKLYESFVTLKDGVADMLDTSSDLLGDDWIVDQAKNITQAINGNEDALHQLEKAANKEIFENLNIAPELDLSNFEGSMDEFWNRFNELPQGYDLTLDADIKNFIQQMVTAMQQAGMTEAEIESRLAGMHMNVDLVPMFDSLNEGIDAAAEAGAKTADAYAANSGINQQVITDKGVQSDQATNQQYQQIVEAQPVVSNDLVLSTQGGSLQPALVHQRVTAFSKRVQAIPVTTTSTKETTATALRVVSANKASGGKISHRNTTSGRAGRPSSGKSGGGGGRKGSGGGGKSATPKKPKVEKLKTDKTDPYHMVNRALDDQKTKLKEIQQLEDDGLLADKLKAIQKQNKSYEEQIKLLKQKENIANAEQARLKNEITSATNGRASDVKVKFTATGEIANYNQVLQSALDKYNNYLANVYNKYSAEEQEIHAAQKEAKEKEYEQLKKNLEEYEKTLDTQDQIKEAIRDAQRELTNLYIANMKYRLDARKSAGELLRDWQDFSDKVIKDIADDDYLAQIGSRFSKIQSYINSEETKMRAEQIRALEDELSRALNGQKTEHTISQIQERLEQLYKEQKDDLQTIKDLQKEISEQFLNSLDNVKDKFDDVIDQYGRVNDALEYGVDLTRKLFGDEAYDQLNKFSDQLYQNNLKTIQTLQAQRQWALQEMQNAQASGNQQAYDRAREIYEDVQNQLNDAILDTLDSINDWWDSKIEEMADKLTRALSGGFNDAMVNADWDRIGNMDDTFLDAVNRTYGVGQIERLYQSGVDSLADSPKLQQRMNKLMNEQLTLLNEKDKLTQYDLDRAKALYDIEMKRYELEEARNNKTKMRLRRDSQGNYTYQYVEDEEKLTDLQDALAKAENDLYNNDKEEYRKTLDDMYDTYQDYLKSRGQLAEQQRQLEAQLQQAQTDEEKEQIKKRLEAVKSQVIDLDAYFKQYYNGLDQHLKTVGNTYLPQSISMNLNLDLDSMTEEEKRKLTETYVSFGSTLKKSFVDGIADQGGIVDAVINPLTNQLGTLTNDYITKVNEVLTNATPIEEQVKANQTLLQQDIQVANDAIKKFEQIKDLLKTVNEYLNNLPWQDWIDQLSKITDTLLRANTKDENNKDTAAVAATREQAKNITSGDAAALQAQSSDISGTKQYLPTSTTDTSSTDTGLSDHMVDAIGEVLTQDMLTGVAAKNGAFTSSIGSLFNGLGTLVNNGTIEQHVEITANFPNATDQVAIENAILNVVNVASQKASTNLTGG